MKLLRSLLVVLLTAGVVWAAGYYAPYGLRYIPQLTTQGTTDYAQIVINETATDALLNTLNGVITKVNQFKTLGDTGYATLSAAVTTIGATQTTLTVPAGAWVGGGVTVPSNVTLRIMDGGYFTIANGTTLTVYGPIEAGPYQIFSWTGTGAISISNIPNDRIPIQWFGAIGGLTNDIATAFSKAVDSCDCPRQQIYFSGDKEWALLTPVVFTKSISMGGDGKNAGIYINVGANKGISVNAETELNDSRFSNIKFYGPLNGCTNALYLKFCDMARFTNVKFTNPSSDYVVWLDGTEFLYGDIEVACGGTKAAHGVKFTTPSGWAPTAPDIHIKVRDVNGIGFYADTLSGGRVWLSVENYGTAFYLTNCFQLDFALAWCEGTGADSVLSKCHHMTFPVCNFGDTSATMRLSGCTGVTIMTTNFETGSLRIDPDCSSIIVGPGAMATLSDNAGDTVYLGPIPQAIGDHNRGRGYGRDNVNYLTNSDMSRWSGSPAKPDAWDTAATWTKCGTGLVDTTKHRTDYCGMITITADDHFDTNLKNVDLKAIAGQWVNWTVWVQIQAAQTIPTYPFITFNSVAPDWTPGTAYRIGDAVYDTAHTISGGGGYLVAIDVGGAETGNSGGVEPTWNSSAYGDTTTDGDITWSYRGNGGASASLVAGDVGYWRQLRIDCYIPKNATGVQQGVWLYENTVGGGSPTYYYIAESVLMNGRLGPMGFVPAIKTVVGSTTLATGAGATTTTVADAAVTAYSKIFLTPTGANAAVAGVYVLDSDIVAGTSFKITHPANPGAAATINYMIVN